MTSFVRERIYDLAVELVDDDVSTEPDPEEEPPRKSRRPYKSRGRPPKKVRRLHTPKIFARPTNIDLPQGINEIIRAIAGHLRISMHEFRFGSHTIPIRTARQVACVVLTELRMNQCDIAWVLDVDLKTVRAAQRAAQDIRDATPALASLLDRAKQCVHQHFGVQTEAIRWIDILQRSRKSCAARKSPRTSATSSRPSTTLLAKAS